MNSPHPECNRLPADVAGSPAPASPRAYYYSMPESYSTFVFKKCDNLWPDMLSSFLSDVSQRQLPSRRHWYLREERINKKGVIILKLYAPWALDESLKWLDPNSAAQDHTVSFVKFRHRKGRIKDNFRDRGNIPRWSKSPRHSSVSETLCSLLPSLFSAAWKFMCSRLGTWDSFWRRRPSRLNFMPLMSGNEWSVLTFKFWER